jgi:hypothetical protein
MGKKRRKKKKRKGNSGDRLGTDSISVDLCPL